MTKFVLKQDTCKGCGLCVRACPKGLLQLGSNVNASGAKYVEITDEDSCISCACCALNCPDMAISIYKEEQ